MDREAHEDDRERRCPECGAPLGRYARCEELFHHALLMEWEAPGAGEAHHLLVGTYMLQHPSGFTAEGQASYRALIEMAVDERLSAPEQRERVRGRFDPQKRDWNLKAKTPSPPVLHEWRMTIADAIDGPVEDLPARVWQWAESAREELRER
jgi:hypothetical protein